MSAARAETTDSPETAKTPTPAANAKANNLRMCALLEWMHESHQLDIGVRRNGEFKAASRRILAILATNIQESGAAADGCTRAAGQRRPVRTKMRVQRSSSKAYRRAIWRRQSNASLLPRSSP
jgi:hypothetical protein